MSRRFTLALDADLHEAIVRAAADAGRTTAAWARAVLAEAAGAEVAPRVRQGRPPTGWQARVRAMHSGGATHAEIAEAMGWTLATTHARMSELRLRAN